MEQVVSEYLTHLNIPISRKYCEKLIASHPDYPSLLSIADTLQRLGISYEAARIERKYLSRMEYPYLYWSDEHNKDPKIVMAQQYLPTNGVQETNTKDIGGKAIVLKAEPCDTIVDEKNNRQRSQERFLWILTGVLVLAAAGLILLNIIPMLNWIYTLLVLTALAGTAIGYLLIAKEVGVSYKLVESFCQPGGKTNCDAVLRSNGARLFGTLTLSDATADYFLFQTMMFGLLIPLTGGAAPYFGILGLLSLLAVPVVFYSLYYQAMRVKLWCRLCLLVDVILIGQEGLFGYMYSMGIMSIGSVTALSAALTLLLFVATGSALVLVKSVIKDKNESLQREVEANRIKYSPEVFLHLLRRQKRVDITPFKQEMLIGDPEAPINVTMAGSLGCGPCKAGFELAARLVGTWPDTVNMTVRLRLRTSSSWSEGNITPGLYLLHYWRQHILKGPEATSHTKQLLQDWYTMMDLKAFRAKYPTDENKIDDSLKQLASQHTEWFEGVEIKGTPTFFVNGWQLPKSYRIDELQSFIPGLADKFRRNKKPIQQIAIRVT